MPCRTPEAELLIRVLGTQMWPHGTLMGTIPLAGEAAGFKTQPDTQE